MAAYDELRFLYYKTYGAGDLEDGRRDLEDGRRDLEGARVDPRHPGLQSTFHYNGVKGGPACVPTHLGRSACQRSRGIPRDRPGSRR